MPAHPAMQLYRPANGHQDQPASDVLMRIKRPTTTRCPAPPENIATWLVPGWDDPTKKAAHAQSRNQISAEGATVTVRFDDDEARLTNFSTWCKTRDQWTQPEIAARTALRYFELFYEVYSAIEKDEERLELVVGDGHLTWRTESNNAGSVLINHPLLLKRVELRFDPKIPEFTVHDTERDPELYSALLIDLKAIDQIAIKNRKRELEQARYHPLGWDDTAAFLKALAQSISPLDGQYSESPPDTQSPSSPIIWRDAVVFVRERVAGIANAVDAILEDIAVREIFPSALAQITGTTEPAQIVNGGPTETPAAAFTPLSDDDILLAKQSNAEQVQIIRRLHASGSVIVQGPPGTGKTHTIGNIIGHLLAQGKSILVTAHTAKALRVVREQVPTILQPLCVAVLGGDQNTRRQMESSIGTITERLTGDSAESLLNAAERLEAQRRDLLTDCRTLKHKLRAALENEYRDIVLEDRRFTPSQAAKYVAQYRDEHGWIPGEVKPGVGIGLTSAEINRLYALSSEFSAAEDKDSRLPIPDLTKLRSEADFTAMVLEHRDLTTRDLSTGADRWRSPGEGPSIAIAKISQTLTTEFSEDLRRQTWRPYAIVAGIHGGQERGVWDRLCEAIDAAVSAHHRHATVLHHRPQLSIELPVSLQRQVSIEIHDYLASGGRLGMLQLATRSEWRGFIKSTTVAAGRPSHPDHFAALGCLAELEHARTELEALWDSLIGQQIGKPFRQPGVAPEMACRPMLTEIKRCLNWQADVWAPIKADVVHEGLNFDRVAASVPNEPSHGTPRHHRSSEAAAYRDAPTATPRMRAGV